MVDRSIGFIGFGNMARAIARGFLRAGAIDPGRVFVCARDQERLAAAAREIGVVACRDAREVAGASDVVVLAVKPQQVEEAVKPARAELKGKLVVSVASGLLFAQYEKLLPDTHHISTIPNTPVAVGAGVFLCEAEHSLTEEEWEYLRGLLSKISVVATVEKEHMEIASAIAGCGPAFAAMFVEALGDAGVKHGLSRAEAYRFAEQMIAGAGKLMLETGVHPGAAKDAVCSPGGTTITGVAALERGGFRASIINAIDAILA
jgi:pyrroline-5-carboxylate reductase